MWKDNVVAVTSYCLGVYLQELLKQDSKLGLPEYSQWRILSRRSSLANGTVSHYVPLRYTRPPITIRPCIK